MLSLASKVESVGRVRNHEAGSQCASLDRPSLWLRVGNASGNLMRELPTARSSLFGASHFAFLSDQTEACNTSRHLSREHTKPGHAANLRVVGGPARRLVVSSYCRFPQAGAPEP